MGLCFGRIAHMAFLRFEARFGRSQLQNFNAILTNQFSQPSTSLGWWLTILLFICLPLGLSAAYKGFIGGTNSRPLQCTAGMYGIVAPHDILDMGSTGISLMTRVYKEDFPSTKKGGSMQIRSNDFRDDASYWEPYYETGDFDWIDLFNGWSIFFLANSSSVFLAVVPTSSQEGSLRFEENAFKFNTTRRQCRGTCSITAATVRLLAGSCTEDVLPEKHQGIFTQLYPAFSTWYIPMLAEFLGIFDRLGTDSDWALPTFTTVVAAMYWSRMTWLNGWIEPGSAFALANQDYDETHYSVTDTTISIKPTLRASWPLYFVLAVYPLLTSLLMLAISVMRSTPVSKGFGIVSILSGIQRDSVAAPRHPISR
ncbi:hypothetical protein B0I35DRAFT_465812 [Stachybotrys elegans]|uniref:Uncharacterized protein n=1 Tax=Stachybotrys elegans TaxID=80388 RepID=A0A8K0SG17_9HYPO|nr:hypothetical protein B0I35DRAFT_465812 [Stachybotrys elegans]